jgi:hypothetical protein
MQICSNFSYIVTPCILIHFQDILSNHRPQWSYYLNQFNHILDLKQKNFTYLTNLLIYCSANHSYDFFIRSFKNIRNFHVIHKFSVQSTFLTDFPFSLIITLNEFYVEKLMNINYIQSLGQIQKDRI